MSHSLFCLMIRRPPGSTLPYTPFPDTTLFRSIGQQFHPHLQRIALGLRGPLLSLADLVRNAGDRLDMMPDFMRDDIGLRGVACGAEALRELVEECGVEIDALIGGAIEGAHRGLRGAAARLILVGEEIERRPLIAVEDRKSTRLNSS